MDVGMFQRRFGTDDACWTHLRNTRWGSNLKRFTCPDCGHAGGWWLANRRLVECRECHRQDECDGRHGLPRGDGVGQARDRTSLEAFRGPGDRLKRFVVKAIAKGSKLRTDGWGAYRVVAKAGYEHEPVITGSGRLAIQTFPWIHTFIGNMKRMILGTHHWVSRKHVDDDLAEFSYRANRRWLEANLFDRLIVAALGSKAVTYKELTAGAT